MKVPVSWLKDYVNIDLDAKEIGDALTLTGSKVEEIINSADEIKDVYTGKILKIEQHPDSDKLVICTVEVNSEEPITIITGASNMKEGDIVPVALVGGSLPNGAKIGLEKLRGVVSNGMMCSKDEIGINDGDTVRGLMIMAPDTPVGKDIKEVLKLDKPVIDFEITSNRADCLSVLGIARETAATFNTEYKKPEYSFNAESSEKIEDNIKVQIKDKLCRRYMSRMVKDIKIEPSPAWMAERLLEAGVRPINNIVDITNFVMLELGQPMHAYDKRNITSNTIVVSRAEENEKFTTLDENERKLNSNVLVIKDGDKTIGLAGIMGGLNSEVKNDTSEIVLESANFDGTNIRVASKNLNIRTEASGRFEKDLDPNMCELALDRACYLIEKLGAGKILCGTIDIYDNPVKEHSVKVDSNWINKFLGLNISKTEMKECLDRLELKTDIDGENLIVNSPTFRSDINIREDVAEEVARMYGYNKIPSTDLKVPSVRTGKYRKQVVRDKVVEALIASGLSEAICYSFVSPKVFDKILLEKDDKLRDAVKIRNPLGEEYSIMRTTTLPSIMEALSRNYARSNDSAVLFELGKIYIKSSKEGEIPKEKNSITIGIYGDADYFNLKGVVENVLEVTGINDVTYERESTNVSYHPGKTANVLYKNEKIAVLGEIHPDVTKNYGIDTECYVAQIDFDFIVKNAKIARKSKGLPKFPAVTRDLALIIDENILVQQIENIIREKGSNIVESYKLFDIYKGKQIPDGKKSVAYSITYRDNNKTLTDSEVEEVQHKILTTLEYNLGAKLR
ncbi:MAG: phenylalanine--tRNA ligase subunit beta [Clostridium sp.]|nr:phenylalanine--tRNA ligase subunit beta [Clostridium sp.]